MLLRTLVIVALIATLATAIAQACAALGRARVHRAAAVAADQAFAGALLTTENTISATIAGGADPRTVTIASSSAPATCALAGSTGCALTVGTTIEATTASPVGDAAEDAATCQPQCADNVQENDAISEGRIAVAMHIAVTGASGETFAVRERDAIFRTLRVAPYVALIGTRDLTDESIAAGVDAGDDSGLPATVVNVRYVNARTGAGVNANAWQSRGWNDGSAGTSSWDP